MPLILASLVFAISLSLLPSTEPPEPLPCNGEGENGSGGHGASSSAAGMRLKRAREGDWKDWTHPHVQTQRRPQPRRAKSTCCDGAVSRHEELLNRGECVFMRCLGLNIGSVGPSFPRHRRWLTRRNTTAPPSPIRPSLFPFIRPPASSPPLHLEFTPSSHSACPSSPHRRPISAPSPSSAATSNLKNGAGAPRSLPAHIAPPWMGSTIRTRRGGGNIIAQVVFTVGMGSDDTDMDVECFHRL
jgi:hypothetical protein